MHKTLGSSRTGCCLVIFLPSTSLPFTLPPHYSTSRAPVGSLCYYCNLLKKVLSTLRANQRTWPPLCEFGSPAGTADFRNISAEKASLVWFAHCFGQQVVRCHFWGSCYGFIQCTGTHSLRLTLTSVWTQARRNCIKQLMGGLLQGCLKNRWRRILSFCFSWKNSSTGSLQHILNSASWRT